MSALTAGLSRPPQASQIRTRHACAKSGQQSTTAARRQSVGSLQRVGGRRGRRAQRPAGRLTRRRHSGSSGQRNGVQRQLGGVASHPRPRTNSRPRRYAAHRTAARKANAAAAALAASASIAAVMVARTKTTTLITPTPRSGGGAACACRHAAAYGVVGGVVGGGERLERVREQGVARCGEHGVEPALEERAEGGCGRRRCSRFAHALCRCRPLRRHCHRRRLRRHPRLRRPHRRRPVAVATLSVAALT